MSDAWCVLPWVHLCIRTDNILKPCCRYLSEAPTNELGINLDMIQSNGVAALNNTKFSAIRKKMLAGERLAGCKKCHIQEDHYKDTGRPSMRMTLNARFNSVTPNVCSTEFHSVRYIEMGIDNICNLQCKMCSSMFSSRLINRDTVLGNPVYKKLEPNFQKLDNVDLSNLEYVKILGGEPFITPNFVKFLDYLMLRVNPANVEIEIASNGTVAPSNEVIDKLNMFKMLHIYVSLDSYSKSNDYQRYGGSYIQTFDNAALYRKVFKNVEVSFHTVVSILTANDLANTLNILTKDYEYHVSVDFVRDPEHLSLLYAPQILKDWVLSANAHNQTAHHLLTTFLHSSNFDNDIWQKFLDTTSTLDNYYNTNLDDYNAALSTFLNDHGYRKTQAIL